MNTAEVLSGHTWICGRCNKPVDNFIITMGSRMVPNATRALVTGFVVEFQCHGQLDSDWIWDRPLDRLAAIEDLKRDLANVKPFKRWQGGMTPPALPVKHIPPSPLRPIEYGKRIINLND